MHLRLTLSARYYSRDADHSAVQMMLCSTKSVSILISERYFIVTNKQARENVRKAVETRNPMERQNWLGESLRYARM